MVPKFVELLSASHRPNLQFECAWALSNIASGTSDHTKCVVDSGAVPCFVRLISSPVDSVCEQVQSAFVNCDDLSEWPAR